MGTDFLGLVLGCAHFPGIFLIFQVRLLLKVYWATPKPLNPAVGYQQHCSHVRRWDGTSLKFRVSETLMCSSS